MAAHPRAVLCLALLLAGSAGYRMKAPENQAECEKAIAAANMVSYGSGSYGSGRGCFSFFNHPFGYWSTSGDPTGAISNNGEYKVKMCEPGYVTPSTEAECEDAVAASGHDKGGCGYPFAGNWGSGKGCYSYFDRGNCAYWSTSGNPEDPSLGYSSQADMRRSDDGACLAQFDNNWASTCEDARWYCTIGCRDLCEDDGKWGIQLRGCCPEMCDSVDDLRYKICLECAAGKYSLNNKCVGCDAGRSSSKGSDSSGDCEECDPGEFSVKGGICTNCAAGKESNNAHTACVTCDPGYISSVGSMCTTQCPAGKASNGAHTACDTCAAGTYSSAGSSVCTTCPFGKYSGAGQATCTNCGDAGYNNYDQALWDPSLDGLASEDECKCEEGHKGANCELLECTSTTPVVSLGFLLLEVQWPRHARRLSRNEAFSGISAAFRAFDANSDNRLSVDEVRASAAEINKIIYRGGGRRLTRFSRRRGWG